MDILSTATAILITINLLACTYHANDNSQQALIEKYKQAAEYIRQDTVIHQFAQKWGKRGKHGVMVEDSVVCLQTMFMKDKFIEWKYGVIQAEEPEQFRTLLMNEYRRWYAEQKTCQGYLFPELSLLNSDSNAELTVYFAAPDGPFIMAEVIGTYTENGERRPLRYASESLIYIFYFDESSRMKKVESALSRR